MSADVVVVAEWTESPFTGIGKRGDEIEHRIVVVHYGSTGGDVRHEVRSSDYDGAPDDWSEIDVVELREHGLSRIKADEREWWA